jgi:hypothetical protein
MQVQLLSGEILSIETGKPFGQQVLEHLGLSPCYLYKVIELEDNKVFVEDLMSLETIQPNDSITLFDGCDLDDPTTGIYWIESVRDSYIVHGYNSLYPISIDMDQISQIGITIKDQEIYALSKWSIPVDQIDTYALTPIAKQRLDKVKMI